jgi:succinyl-CoA synthetase alpha subunit
MSILLDQTTRFIIQGITGKVGRFCLQDMRAYGTNIVAGVAQTELREIDATPIYGRVADACRDLEASASVVYVPAVIALDHVLEAFDAGLKLVVYAGDGLPVADAIEMRAAAAANGAIFVGPNTPGIISPGKAKAGFMPSFCYSPGRVGVISRSGSLSYEACFRLTGCGIGQSSVIGIGGDPVKGLPARSALALFHDDPGTDAILYLGEIGGTEEYDVAAYARTPGAKPVASLIVGRCAPPGKQMGHAAALVGSLADTHAAKLAALQGAGVDATGTLRGVVDATQAALQRSARP